MNFTRINPSYIQTYTLIFLTHQMFDEHGPLVPADVGGDVEEDVLHDPVLEVGAHAVAVAAAVALVVHVDQVHGEEGVEGGRRVATVAAVPLKVVLAKRKAILLLLQIRHRCAQL